VLDIIEGKAYLVGDNIDTDQVYPGRYLELTDKKAIGKHCLEGISAEFAEKHARGSVIVAGRNFGCGSSREHAVITLKEAGVLLVIASSFARIFFRNAINLGFPVLTCKESAELAAEGDMLSINLLSGEIFNKNRGTKSQGELLPAFILDILKAGGIKSRYKKLHGGARWK
jgi:3-isopropylmalate/(R)-2-methylmalate dehydratase small subunit